MSRPPRDIHQAIADRCDKDRIFAVATVLKATGSTPCKAGAKAVVDSGGAIMGTIGGGAIEARAQQLAVQAIQIGRPLAFDFNLEGDAVRSSDPICGGIVRVLIDPTAVRNRPAYAAAARARQRRQRGLLLTLIQGDKAPKSANPPDTKVIFYAETEIPETTFSTADELHCILTSGETTLLVENHPRKGRVWNRSSSRSSPMHCW
jgi:xanthine/CO dehydrogenase XdhC/CoxF family maturation factor